MDYNVGSYFTKDDNVAYTRTFDDDIGDGTLELTSLKVPRQFMASSADQYVAFDEQLGSKPCFLSEPRVNGTLGASGSTIMLFENDEGGWKWIYVNSGRYMLASHLSGGDHTQIRPAKYTSYSDAIQKVNDAIVCAKINSRHFGAAAGSYLMKLNTPTYQNISDNVIDIVTGGLDGRVTTPFTTLLHSHNPFAMEVYAYNANSSSVNQNIVLDFQSLNETTDDNIMRVHIGNFDLRPGLTRICPYDVFTDTDRQAPDLGCKRTKNEVGTEAENVGSAYHNTKEVRRQGFARSDVSLVGTLGNKMSAYRQCRIGNRYLDPIKSGVQIWLGIYNYGNLNNKTSNFYNAVVPHLIDETDHVKLVQDMRDGHQVLRLSEVLRARLNLSPSYNVGRIERRAGDIETNESDEQVTVNRDLLFSYMTRASKTLPNFNDIVAIAPVQDGESDCYEARSAETGKLTNHSFQVSPSAGYTQYEDFHVMPRPKKVRKGDNQLRQQMQIMLTNPLTKVTERVNMKSNVDGPVFCGASYRFIADE